MPDPYDGTAYAIQLFDSTEHYFFRFSAYARIPVP